MSPVDDLPKRQRDVVDGLARGLSAKEIAAELLISVNTVKQHKRLLFAWFHVSSTAALLRATKRLR